MVAYPGFDPWLRPVDSRFMASGEGAVWKMVARARVRCRGGVESVGQEGLGLQDTTVAGECDGSDSFDGWRGV